ncbi:hypothetical protein B1F79_03940 [Coxiella-like endosymbiont of Rhipicephalus sanguineus]|uniref:hypothetical protein n=1 Tax=Coxiella-like endosymbiont of Rhipicephalus sanguineus TaxID=1955402 RepID=UPI002040D0FC|nr:hypothetical protein [Coxiella-like endosymbiont of Rhipicephalus sanguineus]MBT8506651.1 hypothetical protein [Coxiella-like endosymbiont of Rhipicephalus sanguineus]
MEKSIRIRESAYRYIDVDTYKLLLEMIKSLDVSGHPELRNSRLSAEESHQLELIISGVMNLYHRPVIDSARFLHEELEAIIAHWIGNQRIDEEDFIEIKCRMESG